MAATFFNVPIALPPNVLLPSIELASSGTLPQPIYPPPSSSGSGQGKATAPQTQPTPAPTPSPTSPPTDQSQESWVKKMWRRYKGAPN